MKIAESLYREYNPWQKHPDVFVKDFIQPSVQVRIRPFFISEDFRFYNEWVYKEINPPNNAGTELSALSKNYFIATLESSNAQSFWGLINNEPAFQLDVYEALDYHLQDHVKGGNLQPGDVMMQLIIAPYLLDDELLANHILKICLEYLSTFPGTRNIIWVINRNDEPYRRLARKACLTLTHDPEKGNQVYHYTYLQF